MANQTRLPYGAKRTLVPAVTGDRPKQKVSRTACASGLLSPVDPQVVGVRDAHTYCRGPSGAVDAATYQAGSGELECYGCGGRMIYVKAAPRHMKSGVKCNVRAFFRHHAKTPACAASSETIAHKAAVEAFKHHTFVCKWPCPSCYEHILIQVPGDTRATTEHAWKHQGRDYRLDVAFLDATDAVVGAVEVWHTHQTVGQKRQDLNDSGLPWYEVYATEVHEAIRRGDGAISAVYCGWKVCPACTQRERESEIAQLTATHRNASARQRVELSAADAHLAHAQEEFGRLESAIAMDVTDKRRACADLRARIAGVRLEANVNMLRDIVKWATEQLEFPEEVDWAPFDEVVNEPELIMKIGQHKGKHVDRLWEARDPYIVWIAGWKYRRFNGYKPMPASSTCGPSVVQQQRARELLRGHCLVCFEELSYAEKQKTWITRCTPCWKDDQHN